MSDALQPSVTLIVLTHQRRNMLVECLTAAGKSRYSRGRTVVVDNASTDGSADAVERSFPDAVVLRSSENKGVAGGRNLGARWALENLDAEFLLFIDDDTLIEPDTVGELVARALEDRSIALVAPKAYRTPGDRRLLSAGGLRFNRYTGAIGDVASGNIDLGQFDEPQDIQACPGFAFFVRREVFERVGFFDERFNPYGWEDADLSLRAGDAGYRLVYAPKAVVYHLGGRIGRGPVATYEFHKARSMFYFVRRHTNRVQWACFLLSLPFRAFVRIGKELLSGQFGVVHAWTSSLRRRKTKG